jgi:hypothetical protein
VAVVLTIGSFVSDGLREGDPMRPRYAMSMISCLRCRMTVALPFWENHPLGDTTPEAPERCPFCKLAMRVDPNRRGGSW